MSTYPHIFLAPPLGLPRWIFAEILGVRKLEFLSVVVIDPTVIHFDTIPACDGQIDGQTDRATAYTALT